MQVDLLARELDPVGSAGAAWSHGEEAELAQGVDVLAYVLLVAGELAGQLANAVDAPVHLFQTDDQLDPEDELEAIWLEALDEARERAEEWWHKRDLADEHSKLGAGASTRALVARWESGGHADTIYPNMAKALQREDRTRHALLHYLLARRERLRAGGFPRKAIRDGVQRCLDQLKTDVLTNLLLEVVTEETDGEDFTDLLESRLAE